MRTIEALRRSGVGIGPDRTVRDAAAAMEAAGVGTLVVVDDGRPVGIVTDRDLVRRVLATGAPTDARVDSVMSTPVVTIDAACDVHDAFALLGTHPVRRLVVVRGGALAGVLSVDDLLVELAADLTDLTRPIAAEVRTAQHDPALPVQLDAS